MAQPLPTEAPPDELEQLVGRIMSIVRTPLEDDRAARLHRGGGLEQPVLLLDPDADREDRDRALLEALALVTIGPDAASSARKVRPARHLRAVT